MGRYDPHPDRRPAVVTGASSGIGAAIAETLAASGFPVAIGARRVERCEELARRLRDGGGDAVALPLDLADGCSVDSFVERAIDALGAIEIAVSNAGTITPGSTLDTDPDEYERQIRVNLLGAHRLVSRVGREMVGRSRGDIVFVTSDIVRTPRPFLSAYMASKWALEGLVQAMQMELEGSGVRVGVVRPGQTVTEMGTDWDADVTAEVLDHWIHWGVARHGGTLRPSSIAEAVVTMVSAARGTHYATIEVQPEALFHTANRGARP